MAAKQSLVNQIHCISLTLSLLMPWHSVAKDYGCPARPLIKPCTCQEITNGLHVTCNGAKLEQLREALENFGQTGQVIWYLTMKTGPMFRFPSFLLGGLNVRHLFANHCNITDIDETAFSGLSTHLESLDLSNNEFAEVPTQGLEPLSALVSLNLNYNNIETLRADAFKGLASLLRLFLYGNKIKTIDTMAFNGVGGNLTMINLGGNLLPAIPSHSLQHLEALQGLQLQENKISSISAGDLENISTIHSLDVLNLALNWLTELKPNAFSHFKALNSLDLEGNRISNIDDNAFNGIQDSLEWLKLGENRLEQVPSSALRNLTKLRQLDLRGNNITVIQDQSLTQFGTNLKFIFLQKNNIEAIESQAFDSLLSLEWLYIHSNKLRTLSKSTFSPLVSSLSVLDVHDNPFDCDCEIVWFKDWVNNGRGANVVSLPKETKCHTPDHVAKTPVSDMREDVFGCSDASPLATISSPIHLSSFVAIVCFYSFI